jgi:hypothetical protein
MFRHVVFRFPHEKGFLRKPHAHLLIGCQLRPHACLLRSVLTMAAQVAWERDRPYIPPVPAIFTDAAAAANN